MIQYKHRVVLVESPNLVVDRPLQHLLQDVPPHIGQRHRVPILTKRYFNEDKLGGKRTQKCVKNKQTLTSPSVVFSNMCLMATDFFATFNKMIFVACVTFLVDSN